MAKTVRVIISIIVFCIVSLPIFFVLGQNIQSQNSIATLEIDNTDVLFDCEGCGVDVSDEELNGLIWGESLGWVNMQPADGGVFNTRLGVLSGNAWGSVSGWVNFQGVFIDPETGEFSGEAFSQNRGHIVFECPGSSCVVTTWRPLGCTDPSAENFDETATVNDGSCIFKTQGCTDPEASNFDPLAEEDDGSCTFSPPPPPPDDENDEEEGGGGGGDTPVEGCLDPTANNFHPFATLDDESCLYGNDIPGCMDPDSPLFDPSATVSEPDACFIDFYGCMDPGALNYDPEATIHDNSCAYVLGDEPVLGCIDPLALNFNTNATQNNGSCVYDIPGNGCTDPLALNFNPSADIDNGTCIFGVDDEEGEDDEEDAGNAEDDEDTEDEETLFPFVDDILNSGGGGAINIARSIRQNPFLPSLGGLLFLLASLLQLLPFREGNLIFSFFSYYATKKYWGTVYDSVTKQPLDPAYVTLFDEAGQAVDTSITDLDGRYNFIVSPGTYFLSAQKTDYQFPSDKLEGRTYDELYSHLYFGGPIVVEKEDEVISRNIPMDPLRFNWNEYAKRKTKVTHFYKPWHRALILASQIIFVLGFLWALVVFLVSPYVLSFVILCLYVVTLVLKALGLRRIPRGYVQDKNGFALSYAVIRIYSEALHREIKHTVVARGGHYLLLVPNGRYTMIVEQKQNDQSYIKVYESKPFTVRFGFIAKKITLHDVEVQTEEEKFQRVFANASA